MSMSKSEILSAIESNSFVVIANRVTHPDPGQEAMLCMMCGPVEETVCKIQNWHVDEDGDEMVDYSALGSRGSIRARGVVRLAGPGEVEAFLADVKQAAEEVERVRSLDLPMYKVVDGFDEFNHVPDGACHLILTQRGGEGVFADERSDEFGPFLSKFTHPLSKMQRA